MILRRTFAILLTGLLLRLPTAAGWPDKFVRSQEPDFLTFEELVKLSENPHPGGPLEAKLERFWKTPIINNEAYYQGVRPRKLVHPKLGPIMTVATWNIEKSFNIAEAIAIIKSKDSFLPLIAPEKVPEGSAGYKKIIRQRERLAAADIILLQEMDIGHKRSGYLNAAAEIAKALGMNYAYGAEQLEVDPVYLGTEKISSEEAKGEDASMSEQLAADPTLYKGVFGSAVLSRYPIKHVEVFQLQHQAYDWYAGEKPKIAWIEKTKRLGTEVLFKNVMTRELKVGGRIYFRVDLEVPELPEKTLTIINIHLEIKCQPQGRQFQMGEILSYLSDIKHPVIVAGDFNAAPNDISPTTAARIVKRAATKPQTWFNAAVSFLTPYGPANVVRGVSNATKNFQDPTVRNIPLIAPNNLKALFDTIENYRFSDGGAFDFRGDRERSIGGKSGTLANSNERDFKGFKTSFEVKRPLGPVIGKLRLDWVFVKALLKDPLDRAAPYRFAPHYGETLEELNKSLKIQVSDHHASVVDLPFEEPKLKG